MKPSREVALAAELSKDVPESVQIATVGEWRGHVPEIVITPEHLRSAVAYFERHYAKHGNGMVIDYHHASVVARDQGTTAPAAGWVSALELRNGDTELWGQVQWTPRAAGQIAAGEFKHLSPVMQWNRPDRVSGEPVPMMIHSVALTNTPFLTEMVAIAEDTANILVAVAGAGGSAMMELLAHALDLPADASVAGMLTAIDGIKRANVKSEAVALVDEAMRDGKVPPALRETFVALAEADLARTKGYIAAMGSILDYGMGAVNPLPAPGQGLTEDEQHVCKMMGLTPEQFLASKARAQEQPT